MKKIKVNTEKMKQAFLERKEKAEKRRERKVRTPEESVILKATKEGKLKYRAIPYVHNADPSLEPFATRAYHYIKGLGTVYCPQENKGEPCEICDFVWDQMKKNKGKTETVKGWSKYLPAFEVFVPGVPRGREEEGVKLWRIRTMKNEMSKAHAKIGNFFLEEDTENWMDPDAGFDIELTYEVLSEDQAKMFNSKFGLESFVLARSPSKLDKYAEWLEKVPNIDEIYVPRTSEEVSELMEKWRTNLVSGKSSKSSNKTSKEELDTSEVDSSSDDSEESVDATTALSEELDSLGL